MRDLAKSALTFPWAVTMAGVQQIVDLAAPAAGGRLRAAAASLDTVTAQTESELDGWLDTVLDAGDTLARTWRGLSASRGPALDSSGLFRVATDPSLSRIWPLTSDTALMAAAEADALRLPEERRPAALRECRNKWRAIRQLTQMRRDLKLDDNDRTPLPVLVDRAAAVASDDRLAAIEAVGTHAGQRALSESGDDPQDVLTSESAQDLPSWSLTMLHAGVGVSFANAVLGKLTPASSDDYVRHAVARFSALCRRSARRGYIGAMTEALGVVARLIYQDLVPGLDREIRKSEPDLRGVFWHGVGRAAYLDPLALLPSFSESRQLLSTLRQEAGDDDAYREAVAGAAWALAWFNLGSPEVVEQVLQDHAVPATSRDAFADGISSAILVQHDANPADPRTRRFVTYAPRDADTAARWASLITTPCQAALDRTVTELQQAGGLGPLFRCRPAAT